jgi:hypothetical protein
LASEDRGAGWGWDQKASYWLILWGQVPAEQPGHHGPWAGPGQVCLQSLTWELRRA